jgi:PTH1 family peptidyl-tRNA hydrolase
LKLIVGLGNPGKQYTYTRHNIGYLILDYLANKSHIQLSKQNNAALTGKGRIFGHEAVLMKPLTFMNASGEAVISEAAHVSLDPQDIIVIHDDIDLEFGQLKIKTKGGSAGHRGIESIISFLNTDHFTRIRIGVGKSHDAYTARDYVLSTFNEEERSSLKEVMERTVSCLETLLTRGAAAAMNLFHGMGSGAHSK